MANKLKAKYYSSDPVLTDEQKKDFELKYSWTADAQKTYGQILQDIMDRKNITPKIAEDLTGLKKQLFLNLNKPDGSILKRFVVSIGVGFELDVHTTEYLLESCGQRFNVNDRIDRAYIYLLEEHKGRGIYVCNTILKELGIPENRMLGELERGEYNSKGKQPEK